MFKYLLLPIITILVIFFLPSPALAQSCRTYGQRCSGTSIQGGCCSGLICAAGGPSGAPICQNCTDVFTPEECSSMAVGNKVTCKNDPGAINTAIGCIPIDNITRFTAFFLLWGLGIGGGIAIILIIYASFLTITATSNPRRLKAGQELLVSALAGLIMIIFSVFLIRLIGVDILKIMTLS